MSFYGQVVYEFTKLFSKFKIGETILEAENIWDQIELTNDKWIVLTGDKDENDNKTISIKHNIPQEAIRNQSSFSKFDNDPDEDIEQLQYGDTIEAATYKFDELGHLTDTETNYYKLPTLDIKYGAEEDDKISPNENIISIEGDSNWIKIQKDSDNKLKIIHIIPDPGNEEISKTSISAFGKKSPDNIEYTKQEFLDAIVNVDKKTDEDQLKMQQYLDDNNLLTNDETICVLSPGDLVESVVATKDPNGHIIDVQPTYFKLPVSPTDLNFEDHTNRIGKIEERLGVQTPPEDYDIDILPAGYDGSYESNVDLGLAINEQVQKCTPIAVTGDLNSMYEDTNDFKKTITETIGQVNGESGFSKQIDLLTGKTDNNVYTVSEALTTLSTQLYSTKSANDNLQNLVASLIKRIEALENTNN